METIEVRPSVTPNELEQAYDIWGTVFPEDRSFFQERLDHEPEYTPDTTWLAFVNGRPAAATQIFPYRMRWGSARLKVGGIGNVATLPEFRRRGLAQQLLRGQCRYMQTHGYDLSLLMTGINPFYEQLGWRTVPDPEWAADAEAVRQSRHTVDSRIRTFQETDLDQISRMYDSMDLDSIGTRIRSKEYWRGQMLWKAVRPEHFLVAENSGSIVAFLRYKTTPDHQLHVVDCGYAEGREQAVLSLLQHALAAETQVTVVKASLPAGHPLEADLQRCGAQVENVTYKMWRSFDLTAALRKMAPELERRILQTSGRSEELPDSLLLSVDGEQSVLTMKHGSVEAAPVTGRVTYQASVELTRQEWLLLLLKGSEALEQQGRPVSGELCALFPKRPYVFWPADHF